MHFPHACCRQQQAVRPYDAATARRPVAIAWTRPGIGASAAHACLPVALAWTTPDDGVSVAHACLSVALAWTRPGDGASAAHACLPIALAWTRPGDKCIGRSCMPADCPSLDKAGRQCIGRSRMPAGCPAHALSQLSISRSSASSSLIAPLFIANSASTQSLYARSSRSSVNARSCRRVLRRP